MLSSAQRNGHLTGLVPHLIPKGITHLQYADDTIVFLKHDINGAVHMKLLLYLFEMLAGPKINFNKSEIFMINDEENWEQTYADIFNCHVGLFPIKISGGSCEP